MCSGVTHCQTVRQTWDALEICCGKALLSRCLRYGSNLQVAAFDIDDWADYAERRGLPGLRNPLDMASNAGMAFLAVKIRCSWRWRFLASVSNIFQQLKPGPKCKMNNKFKTLKGDNENAISRYLSAKQRLGYRAHDRSLYFSW